ncbi:hypothetical protein P4O66_014805 [Electrophorus voltai]|uniref:Uncharacterized protein n=1 Tax=Electrophorus voltai TaxID=2609070 RepID=A0AAD8Z3Q5_9TELE|nr:hypothetical protein P4O66_014805 [Electrophorus voltai]
MKFLSHRYEGRFIRMCRSFFQPVKCKELGGQTREQSESIKSPLKTQNGGQEYDSPVKKTNKRSRPIVDSDDEDQSTVKEVSKLDRDQADKPSKEKVVASKATINPLSPKPLVTPATPVTPATSTVSETTGSPGSPVTPTTTSPSGIPKRKTARKQFPKRKLDSQSDGEREMEEMEREKEEPDEEREETEQERKRARTEEAPDHTGEYMAAGVLFQIRSLRITGWVASPALRAYPEVDQLFYFYPAGETEEDVMEVEGEKAVDMEQQKTDKGMKDTMKGESEKKSDVVEEEEKNDRANGKNREMDEAKEEKCTPNRVIKKRDEEEEKRGGSAKKTVISSFFGQFPSFFPLCIC